MGIVRRILGTRLVARCTGYFQCIHYLAGCRSPDWLPCWTNTCTCHLQSDPNCTTRPYHKPMYIAKVCLDGKWVLVRQRTCQAPVKKIRQVETRALTRTGQSYPFWDQSHCKAYIPLPNSLAHTRNTLNLNRKHQGLLFHWGIASHTETASTRFAL